MRAIVVGEFGPPESLVVEDWPTPKPGSGQVRVDVHAIALNYPDLLVIGGKYQRLPELPFIPGKDAAGVVSAVGENVRHCRIGNRVVVQLEHGAYAEQILADDEDTYVIPDSMSVVDAAAMGLVYQTAHFALIERGHSLVADDLTYLKRVSERELLGSSSELSRGYMECRGLGIINVADLFGVRSVRIEKRIDLIINFLNWSQGMHEERTGLEEQHMEILGLKVPIMEIPVRPGRDMARLTEVAAMVQALSKIGHDSAAEFNERLIAHMSK